MIQFLIFIAILVNTPAYTTINQIRANLGLQELSLDNRLESFCLDRLGDLVNQQYFDHDNPQTGLHWSRELLNSNLEATEFGENLARNFSNDGSMVKSWYESPSHRENIENPRYKNTWICRKDNLVVQLFSN
jgi:uncharacterized protein YkwD